MRQGVARELPTDPEPGDGTMNAALRDLDVMGILEVAPEQFRRPDRLPVAELARISINDAVENRVNDAERRRRAARARPIGEPNRQLLALTLLESGTPVIDALACHSQSIGDLFDRLSVIEPDKGLSSPKEASIHGLAHQSLEFDSLAAPERYDQHRSFLPRKDHIASTNFVKELLATYLAVAPEPAHTCARASSSAVAPAR
jgi:hypothetical protein